MSQGNDDTNNGFLRAFRLSHDAIIPTRTTRGAAGFDLYAAHGALIRPGDQARIRTDLVIELPRNCYGRIADRSSMALQQLHVTGRVIDNDFRGNITILLQNNSGTNYIIRKCDRVAQLICERIYTPTVIEAMYYTITERSNEGFGSSGR